MTTLAVLQLALAALGPVLGAWAHYRLNQTATPPPAPHLGDGHILAALLAALNGPRLTPPPTPAPPPADLSAQLLALLTQLAQQQQPKTGGTAP